MFFLGSVWVGLQMAHLLANASKEERTLMNGRADGQWVLAVALVEGLAASGPRAVMDSSMDGIPDSYSFFSCFVESEMIDHMLLGCW